MTALGNYSERNRLATTARAASSSYGRRWRPFLSRVFLLPPYFRPFLDKRGWGTRDVCWMRLGR